MALASLDGLSVNHDGPPIHATQVNISCDAEAKFVEALTRFNQLKNERQQRLVNEISERTTDAA